MELLEFLEMLSSVCEHRSIHEAWIFCGNARKFMINRPILMSLWQAMLVIPTSIFVCDCGCLKHNWVKSDKRTRLNLDTLDALIRVSLNGFGVEFMDWNHILNLGKPPQEPTKRRALSQQEVKSHSLY